MKFTIKQLMIATFIVALWVQTGIHGPVVHERELRKESERVYEGIRRLNRDSVVFANEHGFEKPFQVDLRPKGPHVEVYWSIAILPCVLLTASGHYEGRLSGVGGKKLLLYYGFGTFPLPVFSQAVS